MTFYEAGLAILEKAGHPLTYQEIAAEAVREGILSHVGQMPEHTMRERLVALAKRQADRRVLVVGPGQFGLTDWGLPEDEAALGELENMGEGEPEGPPHRGRERHPAITKASSSREGTARKRKRRLPPLSTVAQDLLREAGSSLVVNDLLDRARARGLVSEDLSREMFLGALQEENRRRSKSGKRPIFEVAGGETVSYAASSEAAEPVASRSEPSAVGPGRQVSGLTSQGLESRRTTARAIRRLLNELGVAGLEQAVTLLLERSGYRDLRPHTPRASPESGERVRMLTARRKLGLTELRCVVRIVSAGEGEVGKEDVQRLRAELTVANAHLGLIVGPVDATRDARNESQLVGQPLVTLLCADSLAEEIVMREVGCLTYKVVAVNEPFWRDLRKTTRSAENNVARGRSGGFVQKPAPKDAASSNEGAGEAASQPAVGSTEETPGQEGAPAPEIDQFLNETIAPKPPDAEPLEREARGPAKDGEPSVEPAG
jgi:hypothetical protein